MSHVLRPDPRWSSSAIRDLLEQARAPGVISLAGGLPAAELLPTERLRDRSAHVFELHGAHTLQYGPSVGEPALREILGSYEAVHPDDLIVTAGSQQALDLVARGLTRPGDVVVIESPGYVGAIQVLQAAGLDLIACPVDHDGLDTAALEELLGNGLRPALVYVNPNHQNPTGGSLSPARQAQLLALADQFGFWVVADDPYREITFDRGVPSPEHGLHPATSDHVLLLGSLSKTLSPGLRLGWCSGHRSAITRLEMAKQAADLHTATFNQLLAASVLSDHRWWIQHLQALRVAYQERRAQLLDALELHLPDARVSRQSGGFFLWLELSGVDTTTLLTAALEAGVAFVPGSVFSLDDQPNDALRLSYSYADVDTIEEAVSRLAEATMRAAIRS